MNPHIFHLGLSLQRHANANRNDCIDDEDRCHRHKEVKALEVSSTNAFAHPWAVMVVLFNAELAVRTVSRRSLNVNVALFTESNVLSSVVFTSQGL